MRPVRWSAIATLAGLFSLLLAGALLFSVVRSAREANVRPVPDPHATPLDFADATVRSAIDSYGQFTLGSGLDPISTACYHYKEIYRAVTMPGLGDDSAFMAVDFDVAGGGAAVTTRTFRLDGAYAWQVGAQRVVDMQDVDLVRDAAAELLLSGLPAAIDDDYLDASQWVVETCRNSRYHFFRRRNADAIPEVPGNAPFTSFVRTMLALRKPGQD